MLLVVLYKDMHYEYLVEDYCNFDKGLIWSKEWVYKNKHIKHSSNYNDSKIAYKICYKL